MRTRIDVTFDAGTRSIDTGITDLTIEDIRLIVNETQKKVLCSSMQKDLITSVTNGVVTYVSTLPALAQGDKITFEIDQGKIEQVLIPMTSAEVTEMVEDIITDESEES
ncbi:MAG: hypothetical protein II708_01500 [Paludibacteraceae bacterium]|nr:hypothetical protein [Paludibacteraceae bacterium]MBQ3929605.1 hypothetical protein [Paludibacteraceae bacterium]